MTLNSKFMTIDGELIESSATNLAIDLHKEGKIEFIASTTPDNNGRRERTLYFRHNNRLMKLRARDAKHYFQALVNDRPKDSITERKERYANESSATVNTS